MQTLPLNINILDKDMQMSRNLILLFLLLIFGKFFLTSHLKFDQTDQRTDSMETQETIPNFLTSEQSKLKIWEKKVRRKCRKKFSSSILQDGHSQFTIVPLKPWSEKIFVFLARKVFNSDNFSVTSYKINRAFPS